MRYATNRTPCVPVLTHDMRNIREIVAVLFVAVFPRVADACTGMESLCGSLASADSVFLATGVEITPRVDSPTSRPAAGRIIRLGEGRPLRGEVAREVTTGRSSGDCGYNFREGTRYFIHAYRRRDGRLGTSICTLTRPESEAARLIAYVESLSSPSDGGRVWGRVRVPDFGWGGVGTDPLSGARVTIEGQIQQFTVTNASGDYGVTKLPPGQYTVAVTLPAGRSDVSEPAPRDVAVELAHACAIADFDATPNTTLEGWVVGPDGAPVSKVFVELVPEHGVRGDIGGMGAETDAGGHYSFARLPPGRYLVGLSLGLGPSTISPFPATFATMVDGEAAIDLKPGEHLKLAPIVTRRLNPIRIDAIVQWDDGRPVTDVELATDAIGLNGPLRRPSPARPEVNGRFQLDLYQDAAYRVLVRRSQRVVHQVEIVANGSPLIIALQPQ